MMELVKSIDTKTFAWDNKQGFACFVKFFIVVINPLLPSLVMSMRGTRFFFHCLV